MFQNAKLEVKKIYFDQGRIFNRMVCTLTLKMMVLVNNLKNISNSNFLKFKHTINSMMSAYAELDFGTKVMAKK